MLELVWSTLPPHMVLRIMWLVYEATTNGLAERLQATALLATSLQSTAKIG